MIMDLLFQRYADPFLFIDSMLSIGMLHQSLCEISEITRDEKLWQLYLHCTEGGICVGSNGGEIYRFAPISTFEAWKKSVLPAEATREGTEETDVETILAKAQNILDSFTPPGKGGS